jgi:orotidine-5'-phosphate decarboxylase
VTDIAIAYDVGSVEQALDLDARLGAGPEHAKIGLQLFTAAGPEAVRALKARGRRVFLDLKLHDIPNTVHGAARAAARLGADLITVHATGGYAMIAAAVEGAKQGGGDTKVIAVTVLTSLNAYNVPPGFQVPFRIGIVASHLLALADSAGAHGIVCSASDLPGIRTMHRKPFYAVTPGIRPAGVPTHDQQRVATVAEAVKMGSNMLVLGRAVTAAADPAAALAAAHAECLTAEAEMATTSPATA